MDRGRVPMIQLETSEILLALNALSLSRRPAESLTQMWEFRKKLHADFEFFHISSKR